MGSAPFGPTRDLHMRRAPAMRDDRACAMCESERAADEALTARSSHQAKDDRTKRAPAARPLRPHAAGFGNRRTPPATAGEVPQHATAGVNTGIASTLGAG